MVCTAFIDSVKHNGKEWLLHAWQSRQELHCSSILHQNANHAIGAAIKSGTLHVDPDVDFAYFGTDMLHSTMQAIKQFECLHNQ
jgi:hypothetical protein